MIRRVLIIEDDELLREVYATKFVMEGYEVQTAENGETGLAKALESEPDLILLDNVMPRLTGLEVLERYRAQRPDNKSLILMLSNKSSLDDINLSKQLGAMEYLIKSQHTPKDIVLKVRQYDAA